MNVFSEMLLEDKYFNDFYFYFAKPINQIVYNDRDEIVINFIDILHESTEKLFLKYYPKEPKDNSPKELDSKKNEKTDTTADSNTAIVSSNDILKQYVSKNFYGSSTPNFPKPNMCLVKPYDCIQLNKKYWNKRYKRLMESQMMKKRIAGDPNYKHIDDLLQY